MSKPELPEFKSYEEEAAYWDHLDTAPFMEDDGEWFRFDTPTKRAVPSVPTWMRHSPLRSLE